MRSNNTETTYKGIGIYVIVVLFLASLTTTVSADLVPVLPADLQISPANGAWYNSDTAFDGTNYLVVWSGASGSSAFVKGQFIDTNGIPVGNPFIIAQNLHNTYRVSTAFNGANYLVVYLDMNGIYGTFVAPSGTPGPTRLISTESATNSRWDPDVASDGTDFLVVWVDNRDYSQNYGDIYGQRVASSGTLLGNNFLVSPMQKSQMTTSIAYEGNYLVAWSEESITNSLDNDIYGRRVSKDGILLDSGPLPIATGSRQQGRNGVSISPGTSGFLIAWNDDLSSYPYDPLIKGARIAHDGTLIDGPSDSGAFLILNKGGQTASAFDGTNWVVVIDGYPVKAVQVSQGGTVLDPLGVSISKASNIYYFPAIVYGNSNYLVAFSTAGVSGQQTTIFGQILSTTPGNKPPVLTPIGSKSVDVGSTLSFTVTATDPDGDPLTYSATGLPTGATFDPATKTFTWTPGFDQVGSCTVTFIVSDGKLTIQEDVVITVNDMNGTPVPEFPSTFLPATMIIGFLGAVLHIQRTREH
jgi:hypothetical protein